jgi:hypothetical protein
MGLDAAHPTVNGALLDHPGADHESLHPQSHDVLQENLVCEKGFFPVAHGYQRCHRNNAGFTLSHPRVSCCVESHNIS